MTVELHKAVRQVVVLKAAPDGSTTAVELYRKQEKKRKSSNMLKQPERVLRTLVKAQFTMMEEYLRRHERSAHKRRDGWIFDFGPNVFKAARTGSKQVRLKRLIRVPMLNA